MSSSFLWSRVENKGGNSACCSENAVSSSFNCLKSSPVTVHLHSLKTNETENETKN